MPSTGRQACVGITKICSDIGERYAPGLPLSDRSEANKYTRKWQATG